MSSVFSRVPPGKRVPAEGEVVLNVLINSELTKSSETKQVHFQSLPTTPLEIKKKIEEDFSIPSCAQTLHYQSMILKDSDQLQRTHFRSGDTFTVDYPIEAECEKARNVIKWLKEVLEMLTSVEESVLTCSDEEEHHRLRSSTFQRLRKMINEGERDGTAMNALTRTLFMPWTDKTLMNRYYFRQEGGLDVLMKVYGILVSKGWGHLELDEIMHMELEEVCTCAVVNYAQTLPLVRQVVQLGGMEMCLVTLLRELMFRPNYMTNVYSVEFLLASRNALTYALSAVNNFSKLPECQVPIAMRRGVIYQSLVLALHPRYDFQATRRSLTMIHRLAQSPEAHYYIVKKDTVEIMLEICEGKITSTQAQRLRGRMEDPVVIKALKCYASAALAQVGLGSPHLLTDSIPPRLLQQILNLMSDVLESASHAELHQYEEKEEIVWVTFLPYFRYLYKPSRPMEDSTTENEMDHIRAKLYCNVLLHFLENALGRELHVEILIKEGLLDYTMCLPAVLPGECQPRARSLVNELGKHRQLQPPSLCTLAKAHIAKAFCGLQPVMEMNSVGEFLHNFHAL